MCDKENARAYWKEYELSCEVLISNLFHGKGYRVVSNKPVARTRRRIDISVAETRQGGKHFVFDCKDFTVADLNKNEVNTTIAYKKDTRATRAILLTPEYTTIPESVKHYAHQNDVVIIRIPKNRRGGVAGFIDSVRLKKMLKSAVD